MSGYVCRHCGKESPFRWMGGYHCREDGEPFTYGLVGWAQANLSGRWPGDWPLSDQPYAARTDLSQPGTPQT